MPPFPLHSQRFSAGCVSFPAAAVLTLLLLAPATAPAQISGLDTEQALTEMALRQAWDDCPQEEDGDGLRMVRRVGERVLEQWPTPLKGYDYTFYVDTCDHRNAWALPAGHVNVSRGLLDAIDSEDQLAAILAHEVAHVEHRHGYRKWRNWRNRALIGAALAGIAGATDNAFDDIAALSWNVVSQLNLFAHGRDREREADLAASLYLHSTGIGDIPLRQMFQKLGDGSGGGGGPFTTHPHLGERIARAGATETRSFAADEVFHGFNRQGELVATLRFDLQRRFENELSVIATITATERLEKRDNVNTIKLRAGDRRVTLKETTAEHVHPDRTVSAIFRSDSGPALIEAPIAIAEMKLRHVKQWRRAEPTPTRP